MDHINNFYFSMSKNKKAIKTKQGLIYFNSFKKHLRMHSLTFSYIIHPDEKLKEEDTAYKVTDLVTLPFTKITNEQEYALNLHVDKIFQQILLIHILAYFKYKRPLLILPTEKLLRIAASGLEPSSYTDTVYLHIYSTEFGWSISGYTSGRIGISWLPVYISKQELTVLP